ncbi:hypothetical protein M404DRAFT_5804 [Pisolithus tinctorius Marx 270]|uniref:Uncharacterized protein n=1 Tax=Pisolithus tinctorius Marx 270 TaxID=870435 RepID=A0A0C3PJS7_PISTI|nr:hypothetical protein M404DRAFT_5804 [Pisolithus tinctorius Marx 270]
MASYVNLIDQDVLRSDDIFTWPFAAVQLAQSIRDAFKVPSALKSIQSTTTRNDDSTSPSPPPSPTVPGFRWLSNGAHFEAHFLAYPPSAPLPSTCHIPVLCMATEKYLPVVMASLLYQRRVLHIGDPLIGIAFSKYDTIIRLYVGRLDDASPDRILPRVLLGSIETSVTLDLSSPLVSLAVSRLLMSLESPICGLRDRIGNVVGTIAAETQTHTARPWRIDSDVQEEDAVFPSKMKNIQDRIIKDLSPRTRKPAAVPPGPERPSVPEIVTPDEVSDTEGPPVSEISDTILTFLSQMSCPRFADTPEANDSRIFSWLLDRRVAPKSLASDPEFSSEYVAMTGFIWPMTWNVRSQNAVKLLHPDEFPVDLRILEQSSSAIFQGSRRSREKKAIGDEYEVSWRHDHDHLLFDFFIRLVQADTGTLLGGDKSIAHFEDPQVRPTRWLNSRGNAPAATAAADREIESALYVYSRFPAWVIQRRKEKESETITGLGMFPRTGKCDALGCLWVKLPNVSVEDLGQFPFIHRTPPTDEVGANDATKASRQNDATRASKRGDATRESGHNDGAPIDPLDGDRSLNITSRSCSSLKPPGPSDTKETRYTITLASLSSIRQANGTAEDTVEPTTSRIERLQIGPDATLLDLPIVAVEHKKKSNHLAKTMNQLRMHLTASVKFLQTIGITNFPVYGVEADGPNVSLPTAVLRGDDNIVYLIERLVERLDISTPLGAWHYVTILCRLANIHAGLLGERFEMAKEDLITSLRKKGKDMEGWTITHQLALLAADSKAKFPSRTNEKKVK